MNIRSELKTRNKPLLGTIISLGMPAVAESISRCGFDWLWIDMEHAPLELDHVQNILMAKGSRCAGFVRIPINDEVWFKRVLDLGADGVIVPQVKTKEEAQRAVAACKYPPVGIRSAGLARAQGFGMDFAEYIENANCKTSVLLQIEHADGVANVDEILSVTGIDAIIIGPYDLSGSFGKLGQIQDPEIVEAMDKVFAACKRHGVPIGIFTMHAELAKTYIQKGVQLVAIGADIHYMWSAAKASLESVSDAVLAEPVR